MMGEIEHLLSFFFKDNSGKLNYFKVESGSTKARLEDYEWLCSQVPHVQRPECVSKSKAACT